MTDERIKLIIGSLLHDVGKIIYRTSDRRTHAESGYHFLKEETNIEDTEILNQVRYHHARELKAARLPEDSLAYITYIADNIAAAVDRRSKEDGEMGFIKDQPLESVFNILNGNQERKLYRPMMLDINGDMNCPVSRKVPYAEGFYSGVKEKIKNCLLEFQWNDAYVNAILEILEATTTFVPSSTSTNELADISLYDHVKMTAAIATCIHEYLLQENITDYKTTLFKEATSFYSKPIFYLYSMDISGIQDFIYTITSKGALKGLRSRSFYLEIMMEHLIDSLLEKLFLSRVNLIYSGGGHAYILLPNTEKVRKIVGDFGQEVNEWFLEMFETQLYIAGGGAVCSASDFWNEPEGAYREIFQNVSKEISFKKLHRYSPKQVIKLNHSGMPDGERECSICHRHDYLKDGETECEICWTLKQMSGNILKGDFFTVTSKKEKTCLPLPGNCYLVTDTESTLRKRMKEDNYYIRSYSKNKPYSGYYVSTKLWVGDYVNGETFEELGQRATGIERIAVMRADVDNLGQAFVRGFENEKNGSKYVTLSRTATFSRKLSMFFKYHINSLLKEGGYSILEEEAQMEKEDDRRNALIVYSGGDDIFIVGAWDDIIGFAVDLHDNLMEYSQDTLKISAGIGIYPSKYPISIMARETGRLEEAAKSVEGKNAVALFDEKYTFPWEEFIENVVEEKLYFIQKYFKVVDEKGKNFLYNLLELVRKRKEDKINIARFAYLLGRMEPKVQRGEKKEEIEEKRDLHREFSRKMYEWIRVEKDAKELEMAIYLYVYTKREKEEHDGVNE